MYLILTASKKRSSNGKRFVFQTESNSFVSDFLAVFDLSTLQDSPFVRVNIGEKWTCPECRQVNLSKENAVQCSYCDRRTRIVKENRAVPKNTKIALENDIKSALSEEGYCSECFRRLSECECFEGM